MTKKQRILSRALYVCEYNNCNKRATDLAHRIANTQYNAKMIQRILKEKYDVAYSLPFVKRHFIHNERNLAASCREHNDYFNIGFKNNLALEIVDAIYSAIKGEENVR